MNGSLRTRAAVVLVGALAGAAAPMLAGRFDPSVLLNFGPSDHTYLSGFTPMWEIDPDGLATHWSRYDAAVRLPLRFAGGPARMRLRFARVFGETASVEVRVNGVAVDRFRARGGRYEERSADIPEAALASGPLAIALVTDSHEGRDMGLRMDWLAVEGSTGTRAMPVARTVVTAALLAGLFATLALLAFGQTPAGVTAAIALPLAMTAYGVRAGPFALAHVLASCGVVVGTATVGALVVARRYPRGSLAVAGLLVVAAFWLRVGGLFHPLYYYPDLRAHADLARIVHEVGLDFWRRPAHYIEQQGVWAEAALGKTYAFPFSPVFHAFFAPWGGDLLRTMDAMKLAACAISAMEVAVVFFIGRRLGGDRLALWAAALDAVSPPAFSRLGWAFLAAIFAHLFDSLALATLFDGPLRGRRAAAFLGFLLLAIGSYAGSLINFGLFVPLAAASFLLRSRSDLRREGLRLLVVSGATALFVLPTIYGEFLRTFLTDMLPRFLSSAAPRRGDMHAAAMTSMLWRRLFVFFDWWYVPVFAAAPVLWWRRSLHDRHRRLLLAWALVFAVLIVLRTAAPDLFSRVKEMLWLAPLAALAGGEFLRALEERGFWGRAAACACCGWLAAYGIAFYARNILEKFALAR